MIILYVEVCINGGPARTFEAKIQQCHQVGRGFIRLSKSETHLVIFVGRLTPCWYSRETPTGSRTQRGLGRGNIVNCKYHLICIVLWSYVHILYYCKASLSVLAVDERQSFETFTREEKTATWSRTLAQMSEKEQGFDEKKTTWLRSYISGMLNEKRSGFLSPA